MSNLSTEYTCTKPIISPYLKNGRFQTVFIVNTLTLFWAALELRYAPDNFLCTDLPSSHNECCLCQTFCFVSLFLVVFLMYKHINNFGNFDNTLNFVFFL